MIRKIKGTLPFKKWVSVSVNETKIVRQNWLKKTHFFLSCYLPDPISSWCVRCVCWCVRCVGSVYHTSQINQIVLQFENWTRYGDIPYSIMILRKEELVKVSRCLFLYLKENCCTWQGVYIILGLLERCHTQPSC